MIGRMLLYTSMYFPPFSKRDYFSLTDTELNILECIIALGKPEFSVVRISASISLIIALYAMLLSNYK